MTTALQSFHRRMAPLFPERAAERAGVTADVWAAACAHGVDAALLRELHRAICGDSGQVRRADRAGAWTLVAARAGHLRSQPQSFRVGTHVAPAWEPATLARRVGDVLSAAVRVASGDPIGAAATMVWSLARAQPFLGANERVALVVASRIFHAAGLPVPDVEELATSAAFTAALTDPEPAQLSTVLSHAVWEEALVLAELAGVTTSGQTLAEERATLTAARAAAPAPSLVSLLGEAVPMITTALRADASPTTSAPPAFGDRLAIAIAAGGRRRHLCPHFPIHQIRWRFESATSLDAVLVAGAPGRGISGGGAFHFALEVTDIPPVAGTAAPGLFVLPDEDPSEQRARVAAWIPIALERALADAPQASPGY